MAEPARRILLKLSGEALAGEAEFGLDETVLRRLAAEVDDARSSGIQVAIVLGGGNLFRGEQIARMGLVDRVTGDHMGMLATVMNALAFRDVLTALGIPATLLSALALTGIAEGFSARRAAALLDAGEVVLLAGGTGNPFFTTDSAACLRAVEIGAQVVLKATKVDGVYSADPARDPSARRFDKLSYDDVIRRNLRVMDLTAICLCRDNNLPIVVFDMATVGAVKRIATGELLGTRIEAHA